jgi:hypothetical protein
MIDDLIIIGLFVAWLGIVVIACRMCYRHGYGNGYSKAFAEYRSKEYYKFIIKHKYPAILEAIREVKKEGKAKK